MQRTDAFPRFDADVTRDGYLWWYVDALSDDRRHGLTVIAFIGSVFSPYYAHARRRGNADPSHHCALNVALYGAAGKRWSLTERGRDQLSRDATTLAIGPSTLRWDGRALSVAIDELTVPFPTRLRGTLRVHPHALTGHHEFLDTAGHHRWSPVAPFARIEVEMQKPALRWSGDAYLDSNHGDEPLAAAFRRWHWSRSALRDGTAVLYDVERHDDGPRSLALRFNRNGEVQPFCAPPPVSLATTRVWRIPRSTRSGAGAPASVSATLEDTPFYARSVVEHELLGETATSVHESLSLTRFEQAWVQMLLPFRMPRRAPTG